MKKYINLEDMTNTNCSAVLDVIQKNVSISRKEITYLTGLSWGGMTKIVNKLLEHGYVIEEKPSSGTKSGRRPSSLCVNQNKNFVIGLDVNQTGLQGVVLNLAGKRLKEYTAATVSKNKEEMITEITSFVAKIFKEYKNGDVIAIGVAMQGVVDAKNGISVKFPGLSDWSCVPLRDILAEKFQVKVFLEHDPDCMLYPYLESNHRNTILFRIDKSIGMAVAIRNKILKDVGILEIAHTIVIPNGKPCSCGLQGCIEAYLAPCLLKGVLHKEAIAEMIPALALLIKNMVGVFGADTVIITGDLVEYKKMLCEDLLLALKKLNCPAEVIFSEKENTAVFGAGLIAIRKSIDLIEI